MTTDILQITEGEIMGELSFEQERNAALNRDKQTTPFENKFELIFLGVLSISFLGFFAFRGLWIGFIFGHTAALSIMGFYACLTGAIAQRKGFGYRRAFRTGFFVPIIVGAVSAFILTPTVDGIVPMTCGGWAALGTGVIVVIAYLIIKRKAPDR
ncbi:hypothetical protein ACFL45_05290 [Candidatus Neomarinimicrobiota bacterium]